MIPIAGAYSSRPPVMHDISSTKTLHHQALGLYWSETLRCIATFLGMIYIVEWLRNQHHGRGECADVYVHDARPKKMRGDSGIRVVLKKSLPAAWHSPPWAFLALSFEAPPWAFLAVTCTMWRSLLRITARQGPRPQHSTILRPRPLSGQAGRLRETPASSTIVVREAGDTSDLIDQLLWVLGPADAGEPGFVFFDLDETLVTRDTSLIDGLGSTRALMSRLETRLGASSETLRIIHREMERDYYDAETRLVDPLLSRVIRALKIQGHSVFGLTSNALDLVHAPKILEILAKYQIRFSVPEVRGELPRSGALVMDHPVCRGMIFIDNQQAVSHDKGEVIAEFVGLLLQNGTRSGAMDGRSGSPLPETESTAEIRDDGVGMTSGPNRRPRKCVLVDNTSAKCEKAAASFERHAPAAAGLLELHTLHFTEAENMVDSPDALNQLRRILGRLRARGLIGIDLVAEDILVSPVGNVRTGRKAPASSALRKERRTMATARPDGTVSKEQGTPTVRTGFPR